MPRQPRLEIVGLPHHIVQRGVDRQAVFFDHRCYLEYLHLLDEYASHLEMSVHSWCLITNHVHLLLTPSIPGTLSRAMQNLKMYLPPFLSAWFHFKPAGRRHFPSTASQSCKQVVDGAASPVSLTGIAPIAPGDILTHRTRTWHAGIQKPGIQQMGR